MSKGALRGPSACQTLACGALLLTHVTLHAAGEPSGRTEQPGASAAVREIEVVAGRFAFAPDTIEVVAGERVRLIVRSVDVAHGFAIESLGIRQQIGEDGEPVPIEFVAPTPGVHRFECSVYCGMGHDRMAGTLTIVPGTTDTGGSTLSATQSDFTVVTMPTTLPLPRFKSAFRLTHRFTRPLGRGDFGNLLEDFFGFDSSAFIGLEFRFGLTDTTQVSVYRGSNRTIQFFGQQQILRQADHQVSVDLLVSVEGTNNFRDEYSSAIGAAVSRTIADGTTLYVEPIWVGNANIRTLIHPTAASDAFADESTFMVGVGARVRVRPTVFLVAEIVPRVAGFDNGNPHATFGMEKRVGGHGFQLNVSNSLGTTLGQLAQGASENNWYIGFNISRNFF